MKKLIFGLILLFPLLSFSAVYYMDATNGDNGKDGLSQANAWQTIAYLQTQTLSADDSVLFKRGEIWREQYTVQYSGTSGNPIFHSTYGTGAQPIIDGSDLVTTWVDATGNVYYNVGISLDPRIVVIGGTPGIEVANKAAVNSQDEWFWTTAGDDTLFIYTTTGADTSNTAAGTRTLCIDVDTKDYITLDGLNIRYSQNLGVYVRGGSDNFILQNSTLEYCGNQGLYIKEAGTAQDDGLINNNIIRYNGSNGMTLEEIADSWVISNNTMNNNGADAAWTWTSGVKIWCDNTTTLTNNIIENNIVYNNGDGQGNNSGKGIGIWIDSVKPVDGNENIVRYNKVYSNNVHGIYVEVSSNTDVYYNTLYDNGLGYVVSAGIMLTANAGKDCDSNHVYNNTIYAENVRGISAGTAAGGTAKDNIFRNNIVEGSTSYELLANNGFHNVDPDSGSGNIYDSNCFGVEYANFINWDGNRSTYDAFIAASSQTDNNVESNPKFTDAASNDFTPTLNSPVINRGTNVSLTEDFNENPLYDVPDIGAIEYQVQGIYFDASGGDNDSSGVITNPRQTIAHLQTLELLPGALIYFKRGEVWREQYTTQYSGTSGNVIFHGAYGTGAQPIIMGSTNQNTGWADLGGDIWWKQISTGDDPLVVWLDGASYWEAADSSTVDVEYRWFYNTVDSVLYIYASADPDGFYSSIEAPDSTTLYAGRISDRNYITFDNLHFKYSVKTTFQIRGTSNNNIIQNCTITGSGKSESLSIADEANNNTIDNCLIYGDNKAVSTNTVKAWNEGANHPDANTISNCTITNGSHSTLSIVNVSDWVIENNEIYSSYGFGRTVEIMGVAGQGNNIFRYNYVHHGGGQVPEVLPYHSTGAPHFNGDSNKVHTNVFYSGVGNLISLSTWNDGTHGQLICRGLEIYNNTVFGTTDSRVGIEFNTANAVDTGNAVINNIFGENDDINYLQVKFLGESYIENIIFQNNIIYSSATTSTVHDSIAARTVAYMNTNYSSWSNNLAVDPLLPDYTSQSTYTDPLGTNQEISTQENWRTIIANSLVSNDGDQIRIKLQAGTGYSLFVDGLSIGQRYGATDDFTRTPTRITFAGGSSSTEIAAEGTGWSDWINFVFENDKDHLVHWYHNIGVNGTSTWEKNSGKENSSYYLDDPTDYTDSLNITSDGAYNSLMVSEIEVRVLSSFAPQSDSPAIDAGIDWGQTGDFNGLTLQGTAWDMGAFEFVPSGRRGFSGFEWIDRFQR